MDIRLRCLVSKLGAPDREAESETDLEFIHLGTAVKILKVGSSLRRVGREDRARGCHHGTLGGDGGATGCH